MTVVCHQRGPAKRERGASQAKVRICLLGASFDTPNMGVSALAESSIKCIVNSCPDVEVVLLASSRVEKTSYLEFGGRRVAVRTIPVWFSKKVCLPNHFLRFVLYAILLRILPFAGVRSYFARRNGYLDLLLGADLFADITGGDSFSDIYGIRRLLLGFSRKLLPLMFGKKLIMLPQTYGPFQKRISKWMARFVLRRCEKIYTRDRGGLEYVDWLLGGAGGKVAFAPDVAFVLDAHRPDQMEMGDLMQARGASSIVVGLNVSGLLYYEDPSAPPNMFGLQHEYPCVILDLIESLMSDSRVLVLLVPHIFPPKTLVDSPIIENDVTACQEVYDIFQERYAGRLFKVEGRYDHNQIKYIIGQCSFFIGSRMHACIAALSQQIPAVGLAYSKKFTGVFESVGVEDLVIDLTSTEREAVVDRVQTIFRERREFANRLAERIPATQEVILNIFRQSEGIRKS